MFLHRPQFLPKIASFVHFERVAYERPKKMYMEMSKSSVARQDEKAQLSVLHDFPAPDLDKRWRDFLKQADSPSAYTTPEFFLEPYWAGKCPFAILAFNKEEVVGVLTGLHLGDRVTSGIPFRPQLCTKDNSVEVANILMKGLFQEAGSTKLVELYSWHSSPLPIFEQSGFRRKQMEGDVVIDLRLGAEALFKQFHQSRRRNIRLAMRNGIEVSEVRTEQDLAAYWEVQCGWRKTQRKQIKADGSFAEVRKTHELRANHRRFLARYKGNPIAATGVMFCPAGLIESAGMCSLDEFIKLRPNDLLMWKSIEWACEQGFRKYSMGSAHPFHVRSGGVVEPIDCYRLDRTFLHQHELGETLRAIRRSLVYVLPAPLQQTARALRKRLVRAA